MQYLLINSSDVRAGLRDSLLLRTEDTSTSVEHQIESHGISYETVTKLQTTSANNSKFYSLLIFALTNFKTSNWTEYLKFIFSDVRGLLDQHFWAAFPLDILEQYLEIFVILVVGS